MVNSVTGTAVQGIQRGFTSMRRAAAEIASASGLNQTGNSADLARSLVGLKQAQIEVTANVKTLKRADEALGTILDLHA